MKRRHIGFLLLVAIVAISLGVGMVQGQIDGGVQVIVNDDNPVGRLTEAELANLFLRKTKRWRSGEEVEPVDQSNDSAVRDRFSREVLGRSAASVRSYWQERLFSGRGVPPLELEEERAVVAYVKTHPGAIAYVGPAADTSGVKVMKVVP